MADIANAKNFGQIISSLDENIFGDHATHVRYLMHSLIFRLHHIHEVTEFGGYAESADSSYGEPDGGWINVELLAQHPKTEDAVIQFKLSRRTGGEIDATTEISVKGNVHSIDAGSWAQGEKITVAILDGIEIGSAMHTAEMEGSD